MFVCYFLNFINFILHICDKLIWRNKFHRFGTTIKWNCKISIFFIFYFRDSALRYSVINCQCFKLNLLANFYSEFSFESKQELLDWIPSEEEENVQLICLINLFSNIIKKCKKRKKIRKFGTENIFVTHSKKKKKEKATNSIRAETKRNRPLDIFFQPACDRARSGRPAWSHVRDLCNGACLRVKRSPLPVIIL